MRDTYWFLALYAFLVVGGIMFAVIPALFILGGIITGMISIYYGYTTYLADKLIMIGTFTYKHWKFFLPVAFITALGIVAFTAYARKTKSYKMARVKKVKK